MAHTHAYSLYRADVRTSHILKRSFDLAGSFVFLTLASPFIVVVLFFLFVEHTLRGHPNAPFFYTETRISRGAPFTLLKFNIFKYHYIKKLRAEGKLIHTKRLEKNGGVTIIGWVLKQIYMDELPQLFNVFAGNLSIVGPRPLNPEAYEELRIKLAEKGARPSLEKLKGGLTGSFQSFKGRGGKKAWRSFDQEYLRLHESGKPLTLFWFDIKIILRTVKVVLRAKGV